MKRMRSEDGFYLPVLMSILEITEEITIKFYFGSVLKKLVGQYHLYLYRSSIITNLYAGEIKFYKYFAFFRPEIGNQRPAGRMWLS